MAITVTKVNDTPNPDYKEFVCDSVADVANLPTNCCAGSSAFIIETGALYMLNSFGVWEEV